MCHDYRMRSPNNRPRPYHLWHQCWGGGALFENSNKQKDSGPVKKFPSMNSRPLWGGSTLCVFMHSRCGAAGSAFSAGRGRFCLSASDRCLRVGVLPMGHLRISMFVTERYPRSHRPPTSQCSSRALCRSSPVRVCVASPRPPLEPRFSKTMGGRGATETSVHPGLTMACSPPAWPGRAALTAEETRVARGARRTESSPAPCSNPKPRSSRSTAGSAAALWTLLRTPQRSRVRTRGSMSGHRKWDPPTILCVYCRRSKSLLLGRPVFLCLGAPPPPYPRMKQLFPKTHTSAYTRKCRPALPRLYVKPLHEGR